MVQRAAPILKNITGEEVSSIMLVPETCNETVEEHTIIVFRCLYILVVRFLRTKLTGWFRRMVYKREEKGL